MRYEPADRVMRLVVALQASRTGLTLLDIQREFSCGERTAQRMRDAVLRAIPGGMIESFDDGRRKRWRLPPATLTLPVTADELADLETAAELCRRENQRARAKGLKSLATKLRAALPPAGQARLEPDIEALLEAEGHAMRPGPRLAVKPGVLETLRHAVKACREVFIRYRYARARRRKTGRAIEPHGFLFGKQPYLVARTPAESSARQAGATFRLYTLAGIESVKETGRSFTRDPGFAIRRFAAQSFGVFQEEPRDVVWRFSPDVADAAAEWEFHPTQELQKQRDGSLLVKFRAGGLQEMCWHVWTWGGKCEVLSPEGLRTLVEERGRAGPQA